MILNDIRFNCRLLLNQWRFSLLVMMTLAVGIGVSSTGFAIANAVLLRPLPFAESHRLVALGTRDGKNAEGGLSYLDYESWKQSVGFDGIAAYADTTVNLNEDQRSAERLTATFLAAGTFQLLGVSPLIGRDFSELDDQRGAAPVVIISHRLWTTRYGQDPNVVGRQVRINGIPATAIGVMPASFNFPSATDLWQPLEDRQGLKQQPRDRRVLSAFGRLARGVELSQARDALEGVATALRSQYPDTNKTTFVTVVDLRQKYIAKEVAQLVWVLFGAVMFVLLVACANVANLQLSRAVARSPEIAARIAVGGSTWDVVRQLLIESVLLSVAAGLVGIAFALAGTRLFSLALAGANPPYWIDFGVDIRVLAFVTVISTIVGVVCGLAPALYLARTDVQRTLQEESRSGTARNSWLTSGLLAVQVAFTLVLLSGAGLMMQSFWAMYNVDLGIDSSRLTMLRLELAPPRFGSQDQRRVLYQRLEERLQGLLGNASTAIVTLPPGGGGPRSPITLEGHTDAPGEAPPMATILTVTDGYFRTMQVAMQSGREFGSDDGLPGREHAIVNRRFVEQHFPSVDPVGQRIFIAGDYTQAARRSWVTIVGVAPNIRQRNLQQTEPDPIVYLPHRAFPLPLTTVLVRTAGAGTPVIAQLRDVIREVDSSVPTFDAQPLDRFLAFARWPQRVFAGIFSLLAVVGVLLSAVGVYSVGAFAVIQRTREIGIRVAMGAQPSQVIALFTRRMLLPLVVGLVGGLAGAVAGGPLLRAFLVQVGPRSVPMLSVVAVMTIAIGAVASLLAARRASQLDPNVALRN